MIFLKFSKEIASKFIAKIGSLFFHTQDLAGGEMLGIGDRGQVLQRTVPAADEKKDKIYISSHAQRYLESGFCILQRSLSYLVHSRSSMQSIL